MGAPIFESEDFPTTSLANDKVKIEGYDLVLRYGKSACCCFSRKFRRD
jgi:hypothetical protein